MKPTKPEVHYGRGTYSVYQDKAQLADANEREKWGVDTTIH